jgi:hypothetical protein
VQPLAARGVAQFALLPHLLQHCRRRSTSRPCSPAKTPSPRQSRDWVNLRIYLLSAGQPPP